MSSDRGKLGNFLKEVINWNWKEFCDAEIDQKYSGLEATVLALVRTASDGKLGAIKLAIDRIDGKIETPIKIEFPKVWMLYPEATTVALPQGDAPVETAELASLPDVPKTDGVEDIEPVEDEDTPQSAAVMSLRETLNKLADSPRVVTQLILARKQEVESPDFTGKDVDEDVAKKIPLVKSVIAANLLHLAIDKNNFEAITEVFEQIDGKLVETIKILGDDIFISQYGIEAPAGSVKNKDGVYMIEAKQSTQTWAEKLGSVKR